MKKKLILFLMLLFVGIAVANAKDNLLYDWSMKQGASNNYPSVDHSIELEDGYITSTIDNNGNGVMRKISKDGKNIIWQVNDFEDCKIISVDEKDGNIYATIIEDELDSYVIKYNSNGERISSIYLDDITWDGETYIYDNYLYVITRYWIDDIDNRRIEDDYGPRYIYEIDISNNNFNLVNRFNYWDVPEEEINELTNGFSTITAREWENIEIEGLSEIYFSQQINIGDDTYLIGEAIKNGSYYGLMVKLDKNKNIIWHKLDEDKNSHYEDGTTIKTIKLFL